MTGRPHDFDDEDLTAFVRGKAAADLSGRITDAARDDVMLRAEIALLRGLRPALALDDAGLPPQGNDPGLELGWQRLAAQIRKEQPLRTRQASVPAIWRVAAVVLGVMVLGQGGYLLMNRTAAGTGGDSGADAGFRTASRIDVPFVLGVGFQPDAAIGDISALLQQTGARIIAGPGAAQIYRIGFADAAQRDAAQQVLAASSLVALVAEE